ncbi:hypothetical protein M3Y99_00104100 [Aphelenchoides fujianensis]|nr:hypothetical protein M3Y99_00104100 [Aphelenchoides fujianensis]
MLDSGSCCQSACMIGSIVYFVMGERRKPKLRADARRALMVQSLSTGLEHNQIQQGDDDLWQRAALRLRTLRLLFSCRSFPAAFFQRSTKYAEPDVHFLTLELSHTTVLKAASSGTLCLCLYDHNMSLESMSRFLNAGRAEVEQLYLTVQTFNEPSFEQIRDWASLLAPLKNFRNLQEFNVDIDLPYGTCSIFHFLRDFLPTRITSFRSIGFHDFLLVSPKSCRMPLEKARFSIHLGKSAPYLGPLLRSNARVIDISCFVRELAEHGP